MSGWILWVLAAALFGIGEMLTTGFFLAPFSLGAGVAALADLAGAGEGTAVIVFVVASLLALTALRPIALRHMRLPPTLRTGAAALVGRTGIVLERVSNREGLGYVKIDGEIWTARSLHDDEEIQSGTQVEIVQIKGATALVTQ